MNGEEGLFEKIPIGFQRFVPSGGGGEVPIWGDLGDIFGASPAEGLGAGKGRLYCFLGAAAGFIALEADVAFKLLQGGDKAVRMEQGGSAAKVPAYGLIEF
jgi:hypothetical protein